MPYVNIWIHAVWGTKNRYPFLMNGVKQSVINHIKENAIKKEINISVVDGYHDHLHCLLKLNADMSVAKVMQLIKGESSFWINKEKITKQNFEWADEYYAASVSQSQWGHARTYINNQEAHHKKTTFEEEVDCFLKDFDVNKG